MQIFNHGEKQTLEQILASRDRRMKIQQRLVHDSEKIVVTAKLNIPGSIKNNDLLMEFFLTQVTAFEQQLQVKGICYQVAQEDLTAKTGPERFYLIEASVFHVKQITVSFEDSLPARRLLDIDVLDISDGQVVPITREKINQVPRKCFLCDRDAKECARAQRHAFADVQSKVETLIINALVNSRKAEYAVRLAALGVQAMFDEVSVWPKPGLVDPVEHGAHPDMDQFLFIKSALSIQNYLEQCARVGLNYVGDDYADVFLELRTLEKRAEQAMFQATQGINTHKGIIFSLGVVIAAIGLLLNKDHDLSDEKLKQTIKAMLINLESDFDKLDGFNLTAGEQQYLKHQLGGIRKEAASGYPTVFKYGLTTLRATENLPQNDRYLVTLMQIALHIKDSTLIKRAGTPEIIKWKNKQIEHFFEIGATLTSAGRHFLEELQNEFTQRQLSLGGSADLLVLTIFIDEAERIFSNGLYHE